MFNIARSLRCFYMIEPTTRPILFNLPSVYLKKEQLVIRSEQFLDKR